MARSDFAIIIPAYNEERSIAKVVSEVAGEGTVVVVDDCSKDKTAELARSAGAVVVSHKTNAGYDGALESGFRKAAELGLKYAITIDADGQHDSKMVAEYKRLLAESELVLGIRDRKQRLSEHVFAIATSALFGIQDPLCGMKGYAVDIFRSRGHFDSYKSIGTELALYAVRNGRTFTQINVKTRDRVGSSRFGPTIRANYRIFRALALGLWRTR